MHVHVQHCSLVTLSCEFKLCIHRLAVRIDGRVETMLCVCIVLVLTMLFLNVYPKRLQLAHKTHSSLSNWHRTVLTKNHQLVHCFLLKDHTLSSLNCVIPSYLGGGGWIV